jgi:hypothetical protein
MLTAAAGMAGKHDIATAALQELRRAQPNITLAWLAKDLPMRQNADREPSRGCTKLRYSPSFSLRWTLVRFARDTFRVRVCSRCTTPPEKRKKPDGR